MGSRGADLFGDRCASGVVREPVHFVVGSFPRPAVGSVVGIAGGAGACGGIFIAGFAGFILQTTKSYVPLFLIAGTAYLVAFAIVQLISPSLRPARVAGVEESETEQSNQ